MSEKAKPVLVLDRVRALEEMTKGMAMFLQNEIPGLKHMVGALKQSEANLVEVLNAMMGVLGGEEFTKKVQDQLHSNRVNRQKELVSKAVSDGLLVQVAKVSENSLLIGKEMSKDGTVLNGGRSQLEYSQLTDEAKVSALNQEVGHTINGEDGMFEIQEIYELSPQKTTPPAPESNTEPTVNN